MGVYDRDYMRRKGGDEAVENAKYYPKIFRGTGKYFRKPISPTLKRRVYLYKFFVAAALIAALGLLFSLGPLSLKQYPINRICGILPLVADGNADGFFTISDAPIISQKILRYPGRSITIYIEKRSIGRLLEIKSNKCNSFPEIALSIFFWLVVSLTAVKFIKYAVNILVYGRHSHPIYRLISPNLQTSLLVRAYVLFCVGMAVAWAHQYPKQSIRNSKIKSESSVAKSTNAKTGEISSSRLTSTEDVESLAVTENTETRRYASPSKSNWIEEVVRLTNIARSGQQNCGNEVYGPSAPLVISKELSRAAQLHAEDMSSTQLFSHTSKDGRRLADRTRAAGYASHFVAENIGKEYKNPGHVVSGWVNSPGHCKNIMNPKVKEIGVGFDGAHWVQVFGAQ